MKIENHLEKAERFSRTIKKLDYEEDYETLIEDFLLVSSHLINAAMHKLKSLNPDKDIKHNQIYGFLKKENALGEYSEKIGELMQQLEQLRPSHVYGKGKNGETAKKAKEYLAKIKEICERIIGENGRKP